MCKALTELIEDGKKEGLEEGERNRLIKQVRVKLGKGDSPEKIADDLVEEIGVIEKIIGELRKEGELR